MGKVDKKEAFEEWLKEFQSTLTSDEEKAAFAKVLGNEKAQEYVASSVLRDKDYYTRLNELQTEKVAHQEEYDKMFAWWKGADAEAKTIQEEIKTLKDEKAEYEAKLAELGLAPDPKPTDKSTATPTRELEDLKSRIDQFDKGAPMYTNIMTKLMYKALKEGVDFDPDKLLEIVQTKRVPYEQAYDIMATPTREAKAKAEVDKLVEKAREEARREVLSKFPTPDSRAHLPQPPAIERLFKTPDSPSERTSKWVEEFNQMQLEDRK